MVAPPANFLERQQSAKRRTRIYILQFVLLTVPCVIGTYVATLFSISIIVNIVLLREKSGTFFLISTLIYTLLVLLTLVSVRGSQLRRTEQFVAKKIGARRVDPRAEEADARQLYNVVEEMALAAGIAPPDVYIWECDGMINSLTIGKSESDAAIFVSRGAVNALSRAEMQALIGYGMSQILNGDMALNIRLATYMYAFRFAPRVTNFFLTPPGGKTWDEQAKGFLIWLVFMVWPGLLLAIVTGPQYLCARLLQFSISRQRQKLADASALQFTRDRGALIGLFAKAIALTTMPPRPSRLLEDLAHSCFAPPLDQADFLQTHLPLEKRLRTLDPGFDMDRIGEYRCEANSLAEARKNEALQQQQMQERQEARRTEVSRLSDQLAAFIPALAAASEEKRKTVEAARTEALRPLAGADDARTDLIALLLDVRPEGRHLQLAAVRERFGDEGLIALASVVRAAKPSDHAQRVIALDTLLPRLRQLPPAELTRLRETIIALEKADSSVDVFEYALSRRAAVFIGDLLKPREPHGKRLLADCQQELQVLFSVMARHSAPRLAPRAYEAGVLTAGAPSSGRYQELSDWIQPLDAALGKLEHLQPLAKKLLLEALHRIASYDGEETQGERELIRAIASSLHCPIERDFRRVSDDESPLLAARATSNRHGRETATTSPGLAGSDT